MLAALFVAFFSATPAPEPPVGAAVRLETRGVTLDGIVVARDASGWRLRLSNGDVFVPADLVASVRVRADAIKLPPVPQKPVLEPLTPRTRPPSIRAKGAVWITSFPALLTIAGGASPATRETAIDDSVSVLATSVSGSAEMGVRFLAIGASAGFERGASTLVARGKDVCRADSPSICYEMPRGLQHETQAFTGGVWLKPNVVFGAFRVSALAGMELTQIEYAYHDGTTKYGSGTASASAPIAGAGLDWASPTRSFVASAAVHAGSPTYREEIDDLFGTPWKSGVTAARPPVRWSIGLAIPLGGGR